MMAQANGGVRAATMQRRRSMRRALDQPDGGMRFSERWINHQLGATTTGAATVESPTWFRPQMRSRRCSAA